MMSIEKILDIINNKKYVNIKRYEHDKYIDFTMTLEEGGMIRIAQEVVEESSKFKIFGKTSRTFVYDICLLIPNKELVIEKWFFYPTDVKYSEVVLAFNRAYNNEWEVRYNEYKQYFPIENENN